MTATSRLWPSVLGGVLAIATMGCSANGEDGTPVPPTPPSTSVLATTIPPPTSVNTTTTTTDGSSTTAPPTATSVSSTGVAPPPSTGPLPCDTTGFSRTPREHLTMPDAVAVLTTLRTGSHDCYERVTFAFATGASPQYSVAPAEPPFVGPSGEPVPVRGSSYLEVRFATTDAHAADGSTGFIAASTVPVGFRAITEIRLVEDFEAVVRLVIGLDAPRPFRVLVLDGPPRVVVDVARPAP